MQQHEERGVVEVIGRGEKQRHDLVLHASEQLAAGKVASARLGVALRQAFEQLDGARVRLAQDGLAVSVSFEDELLAAAWDRFARKPFWDRAA